MVRQETLESERIASRFEITSVGSAGVCQTPVIGGT
jgi:hypothetical protein